MTRRIKKVAILGSGVMGSGIACHFANVGVEVLLIDIIPKELTESEKAKGLTINSKIVRNRIVNESLQKTLTSKPSPIYKQEFASRITTGNFDDDLPAIKNCDWIIEVVVERLDIKQQIFEKVEKFRKAGTIISSNTSGIPIKLLAEGRTDDFKANFCGTHFFNPPRYLQLFEIIPSPDTSSEVIEFLHYYASKFLGKTTVLCKDTPAFIANRVGTYSIMALFNSIKQLGLTIPEIDKLTGPVIGRAKSATFRTADVVGLDTLVHVANGIAQSTKDEANEIFAIPDYLTQMLNNKWLGQKTNQGFYKKSSDENGKKVIYDLDIETLEYKLSPKPNFDVFEKTKNVDDLNERMRILLNDKGKAGEFYRTSFFGLFEFVSNRIPEIADNLYQIDDALNAGFGWKMGPFQVWDAFGVDKALKMMEENGIKAAEWVYEMVKNGFNSFYKVENGKKLFYNIVNKEYRTIPGTENVLSLEVLKHTNVLWKNKDASIIDLGDGVINVEFHSKMNTIGAGTLQALNKAIDMAENNYKGVIVHNNGDHFSAGANVGMIFMMAVEQEFDELEMAVRYFQNTMMRMRYSSIPVISAPHNMTLGGGCELSMHCDKVIAHSELYMGLVEFGVGVIPGGGGSKEFALRLADELKKGDVRSNAFYERFITIGQAKVSTSAHEAFELGYLRKGVDEVIVSRVNQLNYAKQQILLMHEKGYTQPTPRNDIKVLGNEALGSVYVGADAFTAGKYMSEHDKLIAEKLGFVLAGGDVSQPLTEVSEQYLLNIERRAFLELCATRKTLERMQSLIKKGKILRN